MRALLRWCCCCFVVEVKVLLKNVVGVKVFLKHVWVQLYMVLCFTSTNLVSVVVYLNSTLHCNSIQRALKPWSFTLYILTRRRAGVREQEWEWIVSFQKLGRGREWKKMSQKLRNGKGIKKNPKFGNGKGLIKFIPKIQNGKGRKNPILRFIGPSSEKEGPFQNFLPISPL